MSFEDDDPHRVNLFRNKFNGYNYYEWMKALKELLRIEDKSHVLESKVPKIPPISQPYPERIKKISDEYEVRYLIWKSISCKRVGKLTDLHSHKMIKKVQECFSLIRNWRFGIVKEITRPMKFSWEVGPHVDRLEAYIIRLRKLGYAVSQDMAIDLILSSLSKEYSTFVDNYIKTSSGSTLSNLKEFLLEEEKKLKPKEKGKTLINSNSSRLHLKNLDKPEFSGMLVIFSIGSFIAKV